MTATNKTYQGLLSLHDHGDSLDVLFLSSVDRPLAEELEWMSGKVVSIRYWITDKEVSLEEAQKAYIYQILGGSAYARFSVHYSETTGYLFTDEDLQVGGHDLLAELFVHVGEWLILEIEVGDKP